MRSILVILAAVIGLFATIEIGDRMIDSPCVMKNDITLGGDRLTIVECDDTTQRYYAYSSRLVGYCGPENRRYFANHEDEFVGPCTVIQENPWNELPARSAPAR
jgi:hypothetical protein